MSKTKVNLEDIFPMRCRDCGRHVREVGGNARMTWFTRDLKQRWCNTDECRAIVRRRSFQVINGGLSGRA